MNEQEEALTGAYYMTPADELLLTYDAVPMVDLSLVYSPVLPNQWSEKPVEVLRTVGGKYLLRYGRVQNLRGDITDTMAAEVVDEETLRFMRARYLIRRDYYALYFDVQPLAYYERDRLLHDYFQGGLYQPPKELLGKSRRAWRLHLEAVKSAPPPDKNTVEGTLRAIHLSLVQEKSDPL
jgi:uncharacterized protein (DUF1330 family)